MSTQYAIKATALQNCLNSYWVTPEIAITAKTIKSHPMNDFVSTIKLFESLYQETREYDTSKGLQESHEVIRARRFKVLTETLQLLDSMHEEYKTRLQTLTHKSFV